MTVIVGVEGGDGALLAGDSFNGNRNHHRRRGAPKLFQRGPMVVGTCGSVRWNQLLKYRLEVPTRPEGASAEEYMATEVADAIRECLSEYGWMEKDDNRERGGMALIGYDGRVWKVGRDFDVLYMADGYDATGAGEDIALGALHATEGADAETRVWAALRACGEHSPWVAPPYHVIREGEDEPTEVAA